MQTYQYSIFRRVEWRWILGESDPPEFAFPSASPFANWSLVNPLVPPPDGDIPEFFESRAQSIPIGDGKCFVTHQRMDFRSPIDDDETALQEIMKLLRWLRFSTGQASLATDIAAHQKYPGVAARPRLPAPFGEPPAMALMPYIRASALSFDRVQAALAANPAMIVPVYGDVLLDAIEADGDDRKVILYAAIAVEVMASTRLDEMYDAARQATPADFRVVPIAQAGGVTIQKDPIFEELRKGARRDFRFLLHELPLYVIRRSMMVENERLFQTLNTLHRTRNKLVHSGDIDSADLLSIDYQGAKRGVRAAMEAYRWFSAPGRYVTMYGPTWPAG